MSSDGPGRPTRRRRRRLWALLIGLAVGVVVLEVGSCLIVRTGLISARVPTYQLGTSAATFWGDVSPEFGVWHLPGIRYRHQKACFDVIYESNAYGMRDVERALDSDAPRIVVLGDSFMEGYGVALADRMSNVRERQTGIPHLNFGTSGNAGSTHAAVLYMKFASRFRHDAVIAAILPENDFDDDLPKPDRYQAYWHGDHPAYELRYSLPSVEQSVYRANASAAAFDLGHALREFTYTKNVIDVFYSAYKQGRNRSKLAGAVDQPDSRFFRYTREEFHRLCHSYERMAAAAAPRPVVLFTIPRLSDFAAHESAGRNPLDDELAKWAAGIDNVHFVPLLPALLRRHGEDLSALFLSCDPHWSPAGHCATAEILTAAVGEALAVR